MHLLNKIALQTPESVELEFTLAGIGNRTLALLIDYIVLSLTLLLTGFIWVIFSTQIASILELTTGSSDNLRLWFRAIFLLINYFIYTGYFVLFETLWQGQTPGKRYIKIRVIRDDGRRVRIQQAALRSLLRPIDDIIFIGVFFIIFGAKEKRLGDWAAGTIVIQEEYLVATASFAVSKRARELATQLPQMVNMSQLLPDDFAAIREYLQRRTALSPQARTDLSLQMARQVRKIVVLEQIPAGLKPEVFLEAVYLAYQQEGH
jgi:uncharacterized RDD family membrane protein YckC